MRLRAFLAAFLVAPALAALAQNEPPVEEAKLLAETDARIAKTRTAPLTVTVRDAAGRPVPGAKVQVEHVRHFFRFGAGFNQKLMPRANETDADRRHRDAFLRLFNYSTVHLYWGGYEPRAGEPKHEERLRSMRWLREHGLAARGHPIFWNQVGTVPGWIGDPSADEMRRLLDARLAQLSATVLPELHDVDVFNELTHWERIPGPFTRLLAGQGKVEITAHYLREARRLNPKLQLVVNDYDQTPAYAALLRQLLDAGAPIDIIGQQSHMHSGTWSAGKVWAILERLSALGKPVLFTEHSVLSGPQRKIDWKDGGQRIADWTSDPEHERAQADYQEMFYRLAYSHPACLGVVAWDFSDRGAWLGAPVGLVRADGTPKPAYDRLEALIHQRWRTRGEFTTDADGRVVAPGAFEGEYRVRSGAATASGEHRAATPAEITLTRAD